MRRGGGRRLQDEQQPAGQPQRSAREEALVGALRRLEAGTMSSGGAVAEAAELARAVAEAVEASGGDPLPAVPSAAAPLGSGAAAVGADSDQPPPASAEALEQQRQEAVLACETAAAAQQSAEDTLSSLRAAHARAEEGRAAELRAAAARVTSVEGELTSLDRCAALLIGPSY